MDSFFGIGLMELFVIAVIALIVLGPERLPGAMRSVANFMRQLREVGSEFTSQFSDEIKMIEEMDPRRMINDVLDPSKTPSPSKSQPAKPPVQNTAKPLAQSTAKGAAPAKPKADQPVSNAVAEQNTILPPINSAPQPTADPSSTEAQPAPVAPVADAAALPPSANHGAAGGVESDDTSSAAAEATR